MDKRDDGAKAEVKRDLLLDSETDRVKDALFELVSSKGAVFTLPRHCVLRSQFIQKALETDNTEHRLDVNVDTPILRLICRLLRHMGRQDYELPKKPANGHRLWASDEELQIRPTPALPISDPWIGMLFTVLAEDTDGLFQFITACNYLDIPLLVEWGSLAVCVRNIRGKPPNGIVGSTAPHRTRWTAEMRRHMMQDTTAWDDDREFAAWLPTAATEANVAFAKEWEDTQNKAFEEYQKAEKGKAKENENKEKDEANESKARSNKDRKRDTALRPAGNPSVNPGNAPSHAESKGEQENKNNAPGNTHETAPRRRRKSKRKAKGSSAS
jgi:hypothetical protein